MSESESLPDTLVRVTAVVDRTIGEVLRALGPGTIITAATIRNGDRFVVVSEAEDDDEFEEDAVS